MSGSPARAWGGRTAVVVLASVGCGSDAEMASSDEPLTPAPTEVRTAEVVTRIGGDESGVTFGRVSDLAFDDSLRLFVVDPQAHEVLAFALDGAHLMTIGGQGEGPGEFETPWFQRFDSQGRLWVASIGGRLSIFEPLDGRLEPFETIRVQSDWSVAGAPIPGPEAIRVPVRPSGSSAQDWKVAHQVVDWTGAEIRLVPFPTHAGGDTVARTGRVELPHPRAGRDPLSVWGFEPYAPRTTNAISDDGRYAHAFTSRYRVEILDPEGRPHAVVHLAAEAVAITPEEIDSAFAAVEEMREWARELDGSYEEPKRNTHKPIIRALWFDQQNRLWVERWLHHDAGRREADVFDVDGQPLFQARWPPTVSLWGAASGDYVAGTETDELDVVRVVVLRLE